MVNTPQRIYKFPADWESSVGLVDFPWPERTVALPPGKDTDSAIEYLLTEQYPIDHNRLISKSRLMKRIYYSLKPRLPRSLQLQIQKVSMHAHRSIRFPREPFEPLMPDLLDFHLEAIARARRSDRIPCMSFWPDGYQAAFCFTHDVETQYGYECLPELVELERTYGVRSTINIVPERYDWDIRFLSDLMKEGFEIGIHGLKHDMRLFESREIFEQRCEKLKKYSDQIGACGFRSPGLQRYYPWMKDLPGIYDSSFPDVETHLICPGGCCHILPWFIGKNEKVEIPVTMPQDHYLFNLRTEASAKGWFDKWRIIRARGGLGCVIVHPDYIDHKRMFEELLSLVTDDSRVWVTTASEVATWWLERSRAELVEKDGGYFITGSKRAQMGFLKTEDLNWTSNNRV